MTQPELAVAIEKGFAQPGIIERRLTFFCPEAENNETKYGCCLLGAALIGHFGLDEIVQMGAAHQGGKYVDFVANQLKITLELARAIEWDYVQLTRPRNEVLAKLQANQYPQ